MLQQVIDNLLFGLLVKSTDIEGDEFEFTPFFPHFREVSVDMLLVPVGRYIFPVFSVTSSISTVVFVFLL
jgi:hypothetical protein